MKSIAPRSTKYVRASNASTWMARALCLSAQASADWSRRCLTTGQVLFIQLRTRPRFAQLERKHDSEHHVCTLHALTQRNHALLVATCMMLFVNTAHPGSTAAPIMAIWQTQSLTFDYHSMSVQYPCARLGQRIGAILQAIGAHNVVVQMQCAGGTFAGARAEIVVTMPIEATEENLRAATAYDARDRLIARLQNVEPPTAADVARFPVMWRQIPLSRDRRLQLEAGDCDLIRRLHEQVFSRLPVRVTRISLNCTPGSAARLRPTLEIEALIPLEDALETPKK